ncbi:MAG: hypothetical protein ACOC4C_03905 [Fibrobacterota bacterium]
MDTVSSRKREHDIREELFCNRKWSKNDITARGIKEGKKESRRKPSAFFMLQLVRR